MARRSRGRRRDQYRANSTKPIFGVDVDGLKPGADVIVDEQIVGWPARSLKDIPPGDYFVQALINRYETFHRADGHTIKMPMDQGEGQHWESKPGNFYSKPVKMHVDAASGGEIRISMDQEIPPIAPPTDTAQVKYLRVQNDRLTKFWGRPMFLGAIVFLPQGWDSHPNAHYPVLVHHGHFPKDAASDGWRETPPDASATGTRARQPGRGVPVLQGLERPEVPAHDSRPRPASDAVLRRLLRGELGEQRPVRRRDHARSDPDDREAVSRHRRRAGRG